MRLNYLIGTAVLGLALPLTAVAGDDKGEKLAKALNLSGDRAEQVEQVLENYHEQRKEVKDQAEERLSTLGDQKKSQLRSILTEEEFEQYEDMHEAKKEFKKHKGWKADDHS